MIVTVIGAAIIYYLKLEWWWWLILGIAMVIDIVVYVIHNDSENVHLWRIRISLSDNENRLDDIYYKINEINQKIAPIKDRDLEIAKMELNER